jgi:branched-chain amino acid transport system substrate-binding protein
LAVEEINKDLSPGAGRPFKVIHADTQGSLDAFEAEAVRLTAVNRVAALLGGTSFEEAERMERVRVPVLTPLGSGKRPLGENVFFTGISAAARARALARFAVNDLGATGATIAQDAPLEDAGGFADIFALEFRAALALKSPKAQPVILRIHLPTADEAKKIAEMPKDQPMTDAPAVWVFVGRTDDLSLLPPTAATILLAGEGMRIPNVDSLQNKSAKLYTVSAFHADTAAAKEFAQRYKQAFQFEPDDQAALAYEAMKLLNEAVAQGKEPIREELSRIKDFPGLTGPLTFTDMRQLRRPVYVVQVGRGGQAAAKRFDFED